MAGSQYPEYYVKKRRKESAYRRVVFFIVGVLACVVVGVGIGFGVWKLMIQNKDNAPGDRSALAKQKQDLEVNTRLADARQNNNETFTPAGEAPSSPEPAATTDLSAIEYAQAMPAIKVNISGSNAPAKAPLRAEESAGDTAADDQSAAGGDRSTAPPEQQPANDAFQRSESTSSNTGDKTNPEPEADETSKPAKPAPSAEEDKQPEPKPEAEPESANSSGSNIVFHVYAGACRTKEEAEQMKSNLSSVGFQATIIENKVEFFVKIASLEDLSAMEALIKKLKDSGFSNAFATRSRK